jgi:hypothetical protein
MPRSVHLFHEKPNRARETVPLICCLKTEEVEGISVLAECGVRPAVEAGGRPRPLHPGQVQVLLPDAAQAGLLQQEQREGALPRHPRRQCLHCYAQVSSVLCSCYFSNQVRHPEKVNFSICKGLVATCHAFLHFMIYFFLLYDTRGPR